MNKTFCPNSAVHDLSLSFPPRRYFHYLTVLWWHFPLLLPCFLLSHSSPHTFQIILLILSLSTSLIIGLSWRQWQKSHECVRSVIPWEHGNVTHVSALQLWHWIMPALGRLRNMKGKSFLPPLPSAPLSPFHTFLLDNCCRLLCSGLLLDPIQCTKKTRKKKRRGRGEAIKSPNMPERAEPTQNKMVCKNPTSFRFYWGQIVHDATLCLSVFSELFFPYSALLDIKSGLHTF